MEVAGTVFRQTPCFSSNKITSRSLFPKQQRWNRKPVVAMAAEFSDKGHLQYYNNNSIRNGMMMEKKEMMTSEKKKKEMKKKLKLLKGLSKNLSVFEDMGFGLNLDNNGGLDEQVRGKMISEATEVLIGELEKLKAEKTELKRMEKEEKEKKKAAKMMMMMDCKSKGEESSSSSSSSESECEKMACSNAIVTHGETTTTTSLMVVDDKQVIEKMNIDSSSSSLRLDNNSNSKIEVCMGGKCKKSGAAMLLENFQKAVGVNGEAVEVVGCKCMGKCRDGPNVKVVNNGASFPGLCMGVKLEDVDSIVNDYLFGVGAPTVPAL